MTASRRPREARLHVVDSSAWLEYFAGTERAALFAEQIERPASLVVPVITLYEVFKKVLRDRGEHLALRIVAHMQQGRVAGVDAPLALKAATLNMPLADSLIYATAQAHGATLWTQDAQFEGLAGVRYFPKAG